MHRSSQTLGLLAGWLFSLLLTTAPPSLLVAQELPADRTRVLTAERTDAGEWSGTWFYRTRKHRWALWIRHDDGVPELRFQFQDNDTGENFITDWLSLSRYAAADTKGVFQLTFRLRERDSIEGDWFWRLGTEGVDDRVRTETAGFQMFRAGRGRHLVLLFDRFERTYQDKTGKNVTLEGPNAWTFHKASRRQARWEELPF